MKIFSREIQDWEQEQGYRRGILMPYGTPPDEDVQVQVTEIQSGDRIGLHRHFKQTEYIYVLNGTFTVLFPGSEADLEPGDLIVISPGELHGARNSSRLTSRFLTLKLHGAPDDTDWSVGRAAS